MQMRQSSIDTGWKSAPWHQAIVATTVEGLVPTKHGYDEDRVANGWGDECIDAALADLSWN